jgi:hypothetical protein
LCADEIRKFWKNLWKLNIPWKVRHFVCWACSEALPTKQNLSKSKVVLDPVCAKCGGEVETTTLILWECPLANCVWSLSGRKFQKCFVSTEDFQVI